MSRLKQRKLADFVPGKRVFWFDGDKKEPSLVALRVWTTFGGPGLFKGCDLVAATVQNLGGSPPDSTPSDKDPWEWKVIKFREGIEDPIWYHRQIWLGNKTSSNARVFAFDSPWFLTVSDIRYLLSVRKDEAALRAWHECVVRIDVPIEGSEEPRPDVWVKFWQEMDSVDFCLQLLSDE